MDSVARLIAETYRWQRPLGARVFATPHCCVVADAAHPDVWDANHADNVTAKTEAEMQAVFAAMDRRLGHSPWRVVHSDCLTSDKFLARLALDDFEERFVAIQMALEGDVADRGAPVELRPVMTDGDRDALLRLVMANHAERRDIDGFDFPSEFSAAMVETYRAKATPIISTSRLRAAFLSPMAATPPRPTGWARSRTSSRFRPPGAGA